MRAGKRFILSNLNEDINGLIKILKSLKDSGVLIDGVTAGATHKIKNQQLRFLGALLVPLDASLVQPVFPSVVEV